MTWQGKIIGGSLGSFLGPLGAMAGAAAGHLFWDRKHDRREALERKRTIALFLASYFEFSLCDGPLQKGEDACIRKLAFELNDLWGRPYPQGELLDLLNSVQRIQRPLQLLLPRLGGEEPFKRMLLLTLLRVAVADGDVSPSEMDILQGFPSMAGFPAPVAETFFSLYIPRFAQMRINAGDRQEAARLLGVSLSAREEDVKHAYRKLSMKYHPDRHAELSPEMRALAAEKFTQITKAYDLLNRPEPDDREAYRWGKAKSDGSIHLFHGGESVRCFLCGKSAVLPNSFDPFSTRCPYCGALMTHERTLAEML